MPQQVLLQVLVLRVLLVLVLLVLPVLRPLGLLRLAPAELLGLDLACLSLLVSVENLVRQTGHPAYTH